MKVAFLTNHAEQCGVHQFGKSVYNALKAHSSHGIQWFAMDSEAAFFHERDAIAACDLALCNYHPITLSFLDVMAIRALGMPAVALLHEFDPVNVHAVCADTFLYRIAADPSLVSRVPGVWAVPRIIPQTTVEAPRNDIPTIGSFGFATGGKNFPELVRFAKRHFDRARVRLHITASFYAGDLTSNAIDECRAMADGIEVETTSTFLDCDGLIRFLAGNDLNVFLYDDSRGRGISSVTDFAIAAERPLALSNSGMFRHLRFEAPEFFLSHTSVGKMLEAGATISRRLKSLWTPANAARAYDAIFEAIIADRQKPRGSRVNTVLDDTLRIHYTPKEQEIQSLCPAVYARKIPQANVQQAFIMAKVEEYAKPDAVILCVGYHEDAAYFALAAKGYAIDAIDPVHNTDLEGFFTQHGGKRFYDVIFSTSVIEHVEDDEQFITQIVSLLAPGGVAILTMDFSNDHKPGDRIPTADRRMYTSESILGRLIPYMHNCRLADSPDWILYPPDFEHDGASYSFATLVFWKQNTMAEYIEIAYQRLVEKGLFDWQHNQSTRQSLAQRDAAIAQRDTMLASRSWHVTKPLRFGARLVRPLAAWLWTTVKQMIKWLLRLAVPMIARITPLRRMARWAIRFLPLGIAGRLRCFWDAQMQIRLHGSADSDAVSHPVTGHGITNEVPVSPVQKWTEPPPIDIFDTPPIRLSQGQGKRVIYGCLEPAAKVSDSFKRGVALLNALDKTGENIRLVKFAAQEDKFIPWDRADIGRFLKSGLWDGTENQLRNITPETLECGLMKAGDWLLLAGDTDAEKTNGDQTEKAIYTTKGLGLKIAGLFHEASFLKAPDQVELASKCERFMRVLLLTDMVFCTAEQAYKDLWSFWSIHECASGATLPKLVFSDVAGNLARADDLLSVAAEDAAVFAKALDEADDDLSRLRAVFLCLTVDRAQTIPVSRLPAIQALANLMGGRLHFIDWDAGNGQPRPSGIGVVFMVVRLSCKA